MPVDRLKLSEGFFRTAKHLDAKDRARAYAVALALSDDHPTLPGADDERVDAPPTGSFWARRVPGTALRVLYGFDEHFVYVRSVNYV